MNGSAVCASEPSFTSAHSHTSYYDDHHHLMTATMYPTFQYQYHHESAGGAPAYMDQPMHGDMHQHPHSPPPSHLPALQVTHATPTKLRSRRAAADARNTLGVTIDSYPAEQSTISPVGIPPKPGAPTLRTRTLDDEDARKARKREMGRERQRRKRLRDKEKREAAKASMSNMHDGMGHTSSMGHSPMMGGERGSGSRSSLTNSTSSYEGGLSSASTTYSALPPISMTISPSQSFPMSAGSTSMSDTSSPRHSFSSSMTPSGSLGGSFSADEAAWQEHTAVFGNLNLTADGTVRAKPRATSATLSHVGSRRPSATDTPFGMVDHQRPSPAKRHKSETDDESVGLGVIMGSDGEAPWDQGRPMPRRTASVPDNVPHNSVISDAERSPTPPPVPDLPADLHPRLGQSFMPKQSPEGAYFASTLLLALTNTEWGNMLQQKLGVTKEDLHQMSPDLSATYEKWRIEHGMSRVTLLEHSDASMSPGGGAYMTPSHSQTGGSRDPSQSTNESPMPPPLSRSTPSQAATIRLTQSNIPATPQNKAPSSSSTNSPVHPTLQTPSNGQGMFANSDYSNQQWGTATAPQLSRMYDVDWRGHPGYPSHALSSPLTGGPKDHSVHLPSAPSHDGSAHGQSTLESPVGVHGFSGSDFQPPPRQVYTPGTPVPARGGGANNYSGSESVPMFYNPQFQAPMAPGVHNSPPSMPSSQGGGDQPMFLARGFGQ